VWAHGVMAAGSAFPGEFGAFAEVWHPDETLKPVNTPAIYLPMDRK